MKGESVNIDSFSIPFVDVNGGIFIPKLGYHVGSQIKIESFKITFRPLPLSLLSVFTTDSVRFENETEDYALISLGDLDNAITYLNKNSDKKFRLPTDLEWYYCQQNCPEIFGKKSNYSSSQFFDICIVADIDSLGSVQSRIKSTKFDLLSLVTVNSVRQIQNVTPQMKCLCRLVVEDVGKNCSSVEDKIIMPHCDFEPNKYNSFHLEEFKL